MPTKQIQDQDQEIELDTNYDEIMLKEFQEMDAYEEHMAAYMALSIEKKLLQKIKQFQYKCCACASLLSHSNEEIDDQLLAMKIRPIGQLQQPSRSTLKIVIFANAVMKIISSQSEQGNSFNVVWKTIFNYLDIHDLYSTESFEHEYKKSSQYTHKEEFVIEIVKMYMTLKSKKIGKKITDEERGVLIRHKNKDAIHKAGQ